MVGINPRLGQNYQIQTKKVAAQDEENKQQQTQQAETQAVKQPDVPTLQQPTVKIPLLTLQANVGIEPAQPQKPEMKPTSNFEYDSAAACWRTFGKGIYKKGDTISFIDANGVKVKGVVRELGRDLVIDFGERGLFYDRYRGV